MFDEMNVVIVVIEKGDIDVVIVVFVLVMGKFEIVVVCELDFVLVFVLVNYFIYDVLGSVEVV